jgi:hypothetical protein
MSNKRAEAGWRLVEYDCASGTTRPAAAGLSENFVVTVARDQRGENRGIDAACQHSTKGFAANSNNQVWACLGAELTINFANVADFPAGFAAEFLKTGREFCIRAAVIA